MKTLNEYVLNYADIEGEGRGFDRFFIDVVDYARFLNQTPRLGDFIPCDLEGNVLEKPIINQYSHLEIEGGLYRSDLSEYQAALGRVKFEGFDTIRDVNGYTKQISGTNEHGIYIYDDGTFSYAMGGGLIKTYADLAPYVTLKPKK